MPDQLIVKLNRSIAPYSTQRRLDNISAICHDFAHFWSAEKASLHGEEAQAGPPTPGETNSTDSEPARRVNSWRSIAREASGWTLEFTLSPLRGSEGARPRLPRPREKCCNRLLSPVRVGGPRWRPPVASVTMSKLRPVRLELPDCGAETSAQPSNCPAPWPPERR